MSSYIYSHESYAFLVGVQYSEITGIYPVSYELCQAAVPLGPHKLSACKISCLCVCGFSVAKERRKRMEIHLRAPTTNFPSPRDCSGDREYLYY